jgi:hypothetical protein
MDARLPTHNDLAAFEDKLGREELVWQVAREIATGKPPSFASRICLTEVFGPLWLARG